MKLLRNATLLLGCLLVTSAVYAQSVPQIPTLPGIPGQGQFIPGGQGMGGTGMTAEQYMRARYLQSLSSRGGRSGGGPQRGFDQFAQQAMMQQQAAMQQAAAAAQAQQSTKVGRSVKQLPGKLSEEERRARVSARAAESKAKMQQAIEQRRQEEKRQGN